MVHRVVVGYCTHAATASLASAGAMLLRPFYNENISIGMWAYGAGEGRLGDAIAYYGSLSFVMDATWVAIFATIRRSG